MRASRRCGVPRHYRRAFCLARYTRLRPDLWTRDVGRKGKGLDAKSDRVGHAHRSSGQTDRPGVSVSDHGTYDPADHHPHAGHAHAGHSHAGHAHRRPFACAVVVRHGIRGGDRPQHADRRRRTPVRGDRPFRRARRRRRPQPFRRARPLRRLRREPARQARAHGAVQPTGSAAPRSLRRCSTPRCCSS